MKYEYYFETLNTCADTWSHERFSAFQEDWNRVYKSFIRNLPPNIGHGEVFTKPDEISTEWVDERFEEGKINNKKRAIEAAENIFGLINKGKTVWNDIASDFEKIMNAKDLNDRVKLVKEMYPEIEGYDEYKWINEALSFSRDASEIPEYNPLTGTPKPTRPKFVDISVKDINAHWFRFQSAAKKQLAMVIGIINAI